MVNALIPNVKKGKGKKESVESKFLVLEKKIKKLEDEMKKLKAKSAE